VVQFSLLVLPGLPDLTVCLILSCNVAESTIRAPLFLLLNTKPDASSKRGIEKDSSPCAWNDKQTDCHLDLDPVIFSLSVEMTIFYRFVIASYPDSV
jgi:hypothetical protein